MADTTTPGGADLLTLEAILEYCHNWFCYPGKIYRDEYTIADGVLSGASRDLSDILQDGQYYRIVGSVFNDGLHLYRDTGSGNSDSDNQPDDGESDGTVTDESGTGGAADGLVDETFSGAVWALAIPRKVLALAGEIADWQSKYQDAANSPFAMESFAGYSYTKASGGTSDGGSGGWQTVFRGRLVRWRKL